MAASSHTYKELAFLILPIYLPALLAVLAQAIVISVLPIFVQDDLGGDDAATGTIVSMQGLGAFMTAGFAGFVIARVGDRCGMLVGAGLRSAAYVASWLVTLLPTSTDGGAAMLLLGCARFGTGMGMSTFQVARNSWVNGAVPKTLRGRANGLIGGCARVSNTIGPAVGGVLDQYAGAPLAFFGQVLLGIVNVVVLSFCVPRSSPEPPRAAAVKEVEMTAAADAPPTPPPPSSSSSRALLLPLLTTGPVAFSFAFARASRALLIPLKADSLNLTAATVGYVTAASFAFDSLLFPLAGHIMDRYGRKWAGVPSLIIMAFGCVLLALSHGLFSVCFASAVLGVGNALSSGLVQTVGQDAAPSGQQQRSRFLGLYKVATDTGTFAGPLAVGLVAQAATLDVAAGVIGGATALCAAWYAALPVHQEGMPQPQRVKRTAAEDRITLVTADSAKV